MLAVVSSMHAVQALCGLLHPLCGMFQALCGLLQPLCMMHRRYVECYILYVWCIGAMWAIASSI